MAPGPVVVKPSAHGEQNDEPGKGAYFPMTQLVHWVDPLTEEKRPAAHGTQSAPDARKVPAGQRVGGGGEIAAHALGVALQQFVAMRSA